MDVLTFKQHLSETAYGELDVAKDIITKLHRAGYQAYLVGGCVRDILVGRKPKDYDVCTDAQPHQIMALFPPDPGEKKEQAKQVGAHFGVVIHKGVEIATFRSDGAYGDGRRPDSVNFETDPRQDALRRDFTSNALFMNPFTGEVVDHVGGKTDIKNKLLRAVGDPHQRFGEDHIRMMRAVRFASKLGFGIHPETFAAMKTHAANISNMAVERTFGELTGSLAHDPFKTIDLMHQSGMLAHVLPEVASLPEHAFHLTLEVLRQCRNESVPVALAALFSQVAPNTVDRILKRLKADNAQSGHVLGVLALQPRIAAASQHVTLDVLKRLMRDPFFNDALHLYGLRMTAHDSHARPEPFHFLVHLHSQMKHEDLNPVKFVTGNDLIAMGMKPGKEFKEILDKVENGQLTGRIKSKAQALELIHSKSL